MRLGGGADEWVDGERAAELDGGGVVSSRWSKWHRQGHTLEGR